MHLYTDSPVIIMRRNRNRFLIIMTDNPMKTNYIYMGNLNVII